MLASQRHLFEIDPGVFYLDSAALSPVPLATRDTARAAAHVKGRPWTRSRDQSHSKAERLREHAARLIGASASDLAITCSVSYGLATAARNVRLARGDAIMMLEGDHTSQALTWRSRAKEVGAFPLVVPRPPDGDWTTSILETIDARGSRHIAVASLCATFWNDGSRVDLQQICECLRARDTQVIIDATQSVGVLDLDVSVLKPDFLAFPTYKWLLGPYSLAFLYVAPRFQCGTPLEQNGFNRDDDGGYLEGARRFDMGERDTFVGIPTALESLSLISCWNRKELADRLRFLTDRIASKLDGAGLHCVPRHLRSPHILGVRGARPGVGAACRDKGVYFTERNDTLRISPHVFNDEEDVDACADAILEFHRAS